MTNTNAASKYIPRRPRISINWNPPFRTYLWSKFSKMIALKFFFALHKKLNKSCYLDKKKLLLKSQWGLKGGFQLMLILSLLGMYFDAAVVFVTSQTLLFRFAMAILWDVCWQQKQKFASILEPLIKSPLTLWKGYKIVINNDHSQYFENTLSDRTWFSQPFQN